MFGVSRQTGHDWLKRYRKARSLDALVDRSSVPHNSPTKISEEVEAMVVAARKQRPTWGAASFCTRSWRRIRARSGRKRAASRDPGPPRSTEEAAQAA